MCRECQQCHCRQSSPSKCLCFSIQIQNKYECNCVTGSKDTYVATSDVVQGLLKYNSNLTKYLHKYQQKTNYTQPRQQNIHPNDSQEQKNKGKSIVQIYNLNILPPGSHPPPKQTQQNENINQNDNKPQMADFQQQTSPRNKKQNKNKNPKYPPDSNQAKLQKHFKQMAVSSRYLPDSGFKKYFGRECFQNYGRNNTTGVADGIIYGNYLKTFNISPHCGGNMPITEQSNKQTLIKGDYKKYNGGKVPETHYGNSLDRKSAQGYHKKPIANMPQIIQKSIKTHEQKQKYSKMFNENPKSSNKHQNNRQSNQDKVTNNINQNMQEQPQIRIISPKYNNNQKQIQTSRQAQDDNEQYQNQYNVQYKQNKNQRQIQRQKLVETVRGNYGWQNNKILDDFSQIKPRNFYEKRNYPQQQQQRQQDNKFRHNQKCQRWCQEDNNGYSIQDRLQMKKQIMSSCYRNIQVSHQIQKINKKACGICADRRYTKCCCGS